MAERLRALLVANGALVFMVGLVAGFPFTFVILGKIVLWPLPGALEVHLPGDVRGWRMAHLEGILNGLTLIAVAAAAPWLTLGPRAQHWVAWLLIATAWGKPPLGGDDSLAKFISDDALGTLIENKKGRQ